MKKFSLVIASLGLILITTAQTTFFSSNGNLVIDKSLKTIQDNNINPVLGQYLGKVITSNTVFVVGAFPNAYYQLEFNYINPQRFQIQFTSPSKPIIWMNGVPTNNIRGTILFADLFGGTPSNTIMSVAGTYNWGTVDAFGKVIEARNSSIIFVVATENVPEFSAITVRGQLANSSNISHLGKVIGISKVRILPQFTGEVVIYGELINPLWRWTAGDLIFVNGTVLRNYPPSVGWIKKVGVAKSPTSIMVELQDSVLL